MFSQEELGGALQSKAFQADVNWVRNALASNRLQVQVGPPENTVSQLADVVEATLASVPSWTNGQTHTIARMAAEVAEALSTCSSVSEVGRRRYLLRAVLLYELAEQPAIAASLASSQTFPASMRTFITRKGTFDRLEAKYSAKALEPQGGVAWEAIAYQVEALARFLQGEAPVPHVDDLGALTSIASNFHIELSASEMLALRAVFSKRLNTATRSVLPANLYFEARNLGLPAELWASQIEAIKKGALNRSFEAWGFAAPTGTGKSALAIIIALDQLKADPSAKILYLVPSRALVHEVSRKFTEVFQKLDFGVVEVNPQLVELSEGEAEGLESAAVFVLTPEKADLLLRLGASVFEKTKLVIVDEAHHIEAGTRGVLLEFYLWRIKRLLKHPARMVFLSAVAPNINELTSWMGQSTSSVTIEQRSTRMRPGVYRIRGKGRKREGWIEYSDGTTLKAVPSIQSRSKRQGVIELCYRLSTAGPVLTVAKGKRECEHLAREMLLWLKKNAKDVVLAPADSDQKALLERLDCRLEREMYPAVGLREFIRAGIAYHHAGLPPRVRVLVEDAIKQRLIQYVFATTTLAEGVNFPFSSVVVQSLALREPPERGRPSRYHPITPRVFWNIAGRAGRPGVDREGQAILYEPTLGLEKIDVVLGDYLNPSLKQIPRVDSALSQTIQDLASASRGGELVLEDLDRAELPETLPRRVLGAINLIRIGLVHAKATRSSASPEEILQGTFAYQSLGKSERGFAEQLFKRQAKVIEDFLGSPKAPPIRLVAEVGVSLHTLSSLREYIQTLPDKRLEGFNWLFQGGQLNLDSAIYVVSPIAKRMAELEGPTLGAIYSEVILHWLSGAPLSSVDESQLAKAGWRRLEDLIATLHSRIQYLLPWGLYAADRLIEVEAQSRGIAYGNQVMKLAFLVDGGVPSFNALRLVGLDIERTDAARLANAFREAGGTESAMDIVNWLLSLNQQEVEAIVLGRDRRRIDPDLFAIIRKAKGK